MGFIFCVLFLLGVFVFGYFFDKNEKKKWEQLQKANQEWLSSQPFYFVSVVLDNGDVLKTPMFEAHIPSLGFRFRRTGADMANEWVEDTFKKGVVQIGDEAYPIKMVKKMIVVRAG